ncbi:MAG: hypothetical protein H0U52_06155 [Chloroflexi bacterium]|nr:hypothetical protein [Chloroflexota bacterium]
MDDVTIRQLSDRATALRAQDLTKRYRRGRPAALDRIDLDITAGGITAVHARNWDQRRSNGRMWAAHECFTGSPFGPTLIQFA